MCLSVISSGKRKVCGCNFDISMMESRVSVHENGVFIEALDKTVGWIPLFGAGPGRVFVTMPTCWPYDRRSDPRDGDVNIVNIAADILLGKRTFSEARELVMNDRVCSVPGLTFQGQIADSDGSVLRFTPHIGWEFLEKPDFAVMANFSPFKEEAGLGRDRVEMSNGIYSGCDDFGVDECITLLSRCRMTSPPTRVSLVYTPDDGQVYWFSDGKSDKISKTVIQCV